VQDITPVTPQSRQLAAVDPAGENQAERGLGKAMRRAMIVMGVLVLGLGGLAATVPISGAVIAAGAVSVEGSVKKIGHPYGGVVTDIRVRDGDRVRQGQPLIALDTTVIGAASDLTGQSVDQLLALQARLTAERDGQPAVAFPRELLARADDPQVAAILRHERRNFEVGRAARAAQVAQLAQRTRQAAAEIQASRSQISGYSRQSDLIRDELKQTRELYD